jgi:hypothetical protein
MKIHQIVSHRNGSGGLHFYTVHFSWTEDGITETAIATLDGDQVTNHEKLKKSSDIPGFYNPATRVLVFGLLGGIDIKRTMRGDYFHEELVAAVQKWEKGGRK